MQPGFAKKTGLFFIGLTICGTFIVACASAPPTTLNLAGVSQPVLSLDRPLTAVGQTAVATATQIGYHGSFTFISSDGSVLGLTAAQAFSNPKRRHAYRRSGQAHSQTFVSVNGRVTLTLLSPGTATLTVFGASGNSADLTTVLNISASPLPTASGFPTPTPTPSPTPAPTTPTPAPSPTGSAAPIQTPTPAGSIVISPSPVQIVGLGTTYKQSISVTENAYYGSFSSTNSCAGIAALSTSSGSAPLTLTVTGLAVGNCSATFQDSFSRQTTVNISVTDATIIIH